MNQIAITWLQLLIQQWSLGRPVIGMTLRDSSSLSFLRVLVGRSESWHLVKAELGSVQ